jgi:hypothetical protein
MQERKEVGIDDCIVNHLYGGYYERVYYAGMPSKDVFSIIYETAFMKDNPDSPAVSSHDPSAIIFTIEKHRQLFYPVNFKDTIKFPSRTQIQFRVECVNPTSLVALVEKN